MPGRSLPQSTARDQHDRNGNLTSGPPRALTDAPQPCFGPSTITSAVASVSGRAREAWLVPRDSTGDPRAAGDGSFERKEPSRLGAEFKSAYRQRIGLNSFKLSSTQPNRFPVSDSA